MKRFIKINSFNIPTDVFNDSSRYQFDGTEIYLDDNWDSTLYNGKEIFNECKVSQFIWDPISEILVERSENDPDILNPYKTLKKKEIKKAFQSNLMLGSFLSTTLGITVDLRRNAVDNDLQNVINLIEDMQDEGETNSLFVGVTDKVLVTISQLQELKKEMIKYGRSIYTQKHTLENQVDLATTKIEVANIVWNDL